MSAPIAPTVLNKVPLLRWYFNRSENPAKCWSVDFGPGTTELVCEHVSFEGVFAYSRFLPKEEREDLTPDDPTAWLEALDVTVILDHGAIRISSPEAPIAILKRALPACFPA